MSSESTGSLGDQGGRSQPSDTYRGAAARHGATVTALERSSSALGSWRMATFVVGALAGLLYDDLPVPSALMLAVAATALVVFTGLVVRHRRVGEALRRARIAEALSRLGSSRLERDWAAMARIVGGFGYTDPLLGSEASRDEAHAYLRDLDLFGPASIRALLGPTPTPTGTEAVGRWLLAPAPPAEVRRRQAAARSLAPDFDGREQLAVEALLVEPVDRVGWRRFRDWLEAPGVFAHGPNGTPGRLPAWALPAARALPVLTAALFAVYLADGPVSGWMWGMPLGVQLLLAWRWSGVVEPYFEALGRHSPGVRRHGALFAAWEHYETTSPELLAVQARLASEGGLRASDEIRSLERWLDAVESRASMLYPFIAWAALADVHLAWGLERWRARAGAQVPGWFDALGELEALSALATLAHDHPEWCWPDIVEGEARFEADALGHPMLAESALRTSSVRLDPPGRFLLVTGSNMSGKSTLLRSIGLAAVLAQAGSVVCARRAVLSPLRTFTSMRIHDSITDGVSLFMAELMRLKDLVDAADEAGTAPALLYLIDEVLQGTNSEERRVAARRIVKHLLQANAIGAVTTHDLALHADSALDPASTKVHFREQVDESSERVLTFDYQLREGLATSRNALRLLKIVGLDEE